MMRYRRATRLAREADEVMADRAGDPVSPGWRARRAWRILKDAADRGDHVALDVMWQVWLRHPGDEIWESLARWRGERRLATDAVAAVTDPDRDTTRRYVIGNFCVRRGIVPDEDAERALFFTMAGQPEQRRAADPEGSWLAAAYRAASEPVRAALRETLADSGDLELLRVLAERGLGRGSGRRRRTGSGAHPADAPGHLPAPAGSRYSRTASRPGGRGSSARGMDHRRPRYRTGGAGGRHASAGRPLVRRALARLSRLPVRDRGHGDAGQGALGPPR
jgi:hypothetical protein